MKRFIYLFVLIFTPALSPYTHASADLLSVTELVSSGIYRAGDLHNWSKDVLKENSTEEICRDLSALDNDKLIYFETLFFGVELFCGRELSDRIKRFNEKKSQQHFKNYFDSLGSKEFFNRLKSLKPAPNTPHRPELGLVDTSKGPVLSSGGLPPGYVGLTFDDGPHPRLTPEILDILNRYSVKATFFPVGRNVNRLPGIVQDLAREGHTHGSHTVTHPNLASISYRKAVREIEDGLDSIIQATGREIRFFRFPYGSSTSRLKQYLKSEGFASFFWNIDSLDWKHRDSTLIHNEVVELLNRKQSGIMLFHDIVGATPAAIETLLQEMTRKGYKVVLFRPQK